jgi:hypothetical protein
MTMNQEMQKPTLTPIKNGWAAHGNGWAVHGLTPEEATQKFLKAEQRHREIDKLPFWYEQFETQLPNEDWH